MRKYWDNSVPGAGGSPAATQATTHAVAVPSAVMVGGVRIAPATVLAPMAGVTDTVFRRFIRNLGGCGLIMTEFTSADGILRAKDKKAKLYLHFYEDEHPISAQLFGSDPKVMAEAARIVEGLGFDMVDLNLGMSCQESCEVQRRLGTAERLAGDREDLRSGALGSHDSVYRQVSRRLE